MQTNNSGTWQNERIVLDKKQVIIPALGSYDLSSDWNSIGIKQTLPGDYRVVAMFNSTNGQLKNSTWNFKVQ